MNKQKTQSGFAHILIVTIIVSVALVGALGYIFYQNFIVKKDAVAVVSPVSTDDNTSDKTTSPVVNVNSKTLAISEWSVSGTYTGDFKLTYKMADGYITIAAEDMVGTECETKGSSLSRNLGTDKPAYFRNGVNGSVSTVAEMFDYNQSHPDATRPFVKVGNYYYSLALYMSTCNGVPASTVKAANTEAAELVANLKAI